MPLAPLLYDLPSWWRRQMDDALPWGAIADRVRLRPRRPVLLVFAQGEAISLAWYRDDAVERRLEIGADDAGRDALSRALAETRVSEVRVCVPEVDLLETQTSVPIAAERMLDDVLRYDLDRLTPFDPEEIYWSAETARRLPDQGRLLVRLRLVRRDLVDGLLTWLSSVGAVAAALTIASDGPARSWPSLPLSHGTTRGRAGRWALGAVLGLAVLLGVVAWWQSSASARTEAEIARLSPEMHEAQDLRERIEGATLGPRLLAEQQKAIGSAVATLETLSATLPDDTYLTDLTLKRRQLHFSGQSRSAASLISLLEKTKTIQDPSFSGPVTRAADGKSDVFSLHAETTGP